MKYNGKFVPPPEAPVFQPTDEEFKDPFEYIAKIRPVAEQYGICKIKPPSHWQPPFAVDIDSFKFTPRIQKLNELEAKSRIRLHFLDHLARFWDLQHNSLKIPYIENNYLDFYHLRKFVHDMDGFHSVDRHNKWPLVAKLLGYSATPDTCSQLRQQYSRVLLPYDVFVAGTSESAQEQDVKKESKSETTTTGLNNNNNNEENNNNNNFIKKTENTVSSHIFTPFLATNATTTTKATLQIKCEPVITPITANITNHNNNTTTITSNNNNTTTTTSNNNNTTTITSNNNNTTTITNNNKTKATENLVQDFNNFAKLMKVKLERLPAEMTTSSTINLSPHVSMANNNSNNNNNNNNNNTELVAIDNISKASGIIDKGGASNNTTKANTNAPTTKSGATDTLNSGFMNGVKTGVESDEVKMEVGTEVGGENGLMGKRAEVVDVKGHAGREVGCVGVKGESGERRPRKRGSSELNKLKFIGAGPKMSLPDPSQSIIEDESLQKRTRPKSKDGLSLSNKYSKIECNACGQTGGSLQTIILCDTCLGAYHYSCLILPVRESNRLHWKCPNCIAKECKKPMPSFGFEQSSVEYTLRSFGEMADKFKSDYFNAPCYSVPTATVEQEFWRLVNCLEEDVVVEYGADIHTLEAGSGFPTIRNQHLVEEQDKAYVESAWNINNMPYADKSLLKHVKADINGMKVPWMYIGMCFSSFAWHIEDHWSYSINYMHWGEPKTWYGVPGSKAGMLEECMKRSAPELFEQFPDLLHQLTTIMNTNVLSEQGVPIYRLDQHAGDFVVTFPRSYHSGFNQGYNCAEAVNFCTPDWLPHGVECIEDYRLHKRQCVFSNDEFLCNAVKETDAMSNEHACCVYQVFEEMVAKETRLRQEARSLHAGSTLLEEQVKIEELSDDERQCKECNTTCFLSFVTCLCSSGSMVCLHHVSSLCQCSSHILKYRYTMTELQGMLEKLAVKTRPLQLWRQKATIAMEARGKDRLSVTGVRSLVREHDSNNYPPCSLHYSLSQHLMHSEALLNIAHNIPKIKNLEGGVKIGVERLEDLVCRIDSLCCKLPCEHKIKEYAVRLGQERREISEEACKDNLTIDDIEGLFERCSNLPVEVPEVALLDKAMNRISWFEELSSLDDDSVKVSYETLMRLLETGSSFPASQPVASKLDQLKKLLANYNKLQGLIEEFTHQKPPPSAEQLNLLHEECKQFKVSLPSLDILSSCLNDYNDWKTAYQEAMLTMGQGGASRRAGLREMECLLKQGQGLLVQVAELLELQAVVSKAHTWLSGLKKVLLKREDADCLEALLPRKDLKRLINSKSKDFLDLTLEDDDDDNSTWRRDDDDDDALEKFDFEHARDEELGDMMELRKINKLKTSALTNNNNVNSNSNNTCCTCNRKARGCMLQCRTCLDLFHVSCLEALAPATTTTTWVCSRCGRNKLTTRHLLTSFLNYHHNNLRVQMREAVAIKHLLQRHDRVKEEVEKVVEMVGQGCQEVTEDLKLSQEFLGEMEGAVVGADLLGVEVQETDLLISVLVRAGCMPSAHVLTFPEAMLPDVVQTSGEAAADSKSFQRLKPRRDKQCAEDAAFTCKTLQQPQQLFQQQPQHSIKQQQIIQIQPQQQHVLKVHPQQVLKLQPQQQQQPQKQGQQEQWCILIDDDEEEEDVCSASQCILPINHTEDGEVEWVQCDKCKKWFHFVCLGLNKHDLPEEEEFVCHNCHLALPQQPLSPSQQQQLQLTIQQQQQTEKHRQELQESFMRMKQQLLKQQQLQKQLQQQQRPQVFQKIVRVKPKLLNTSISTPVVVQTLALPHNNSTINNNNSNNNDSSNSIINNTNHADVVLTNNDNINNILNNTLSRSSIINIIPSNNNNNKQIFINSSSNSDNSITDIGSNFNADNIFIRNLTKVAKADNTNNTPDTASADNNNNTTANVASSIIPPSSTSSPTPYKLIHTLPLHPSSSSAPPSSLSPNIFSSLSPSQILSSARLIVSSSSSSSSVPPSSSSSLMLLPPSPSSEAVTSKEALALLDCSELATLECKQDLSCHHQLLLEPILIED